MSTPPTWSDITIFLGPACDSINALRFTIPFQLDEQLFPEIDCILARPIRRCRAQVNRIQRITSVQKPNPSVLRANPNTLSSSSTIWIQPNSLRHNPPLKKGASQIGRAASPRPQQSLIRTKIILQPRRCCPTLLH